MEMNCIHLIVFLILLSGIFALEFPFIHHYETQDDSETLHIRSRTGENTKDNSNIILFYTIVESDEKSLSNAYNRLHLYIDPCSNRSNPEHKINQDYCDLRRTQEPFSSLCANEPEFRTDTDKKFTIVWTSVNSEFEHFCRHRCHKENEADVVFLKSLECLQTAFPEEACKFPECWQANGEFFFGHHQILSSDVGHMSAEAIHTIGYNKTEESSIHTPFIQQTYHNCTMSIRYRITGSDATLHLQLLSLDHKVSTLRKLHNTKGILNRESLLVGQIKNPSKLILSCLGTGNYSCTIYNVTFSDCDDFSHQIPCNKYLNPFQCVYSHHYTCQTDVQCNGVKDCADGKDELDCPTELVKGRLCSLNKDKFCDYWNITGAGNETFNMILSNEEIQITDNSSLSKETGRMPSDGESYLLLASGSTDELQDTYLMSPLFPPTVADQELLSGMSSCTLRLTVCIAHANLLISILVPGMNSKKYKKITYIPERKSCLWQEVSIRLKRQSLPFRLVIGSDGKAESRRLTSVLAVKHLSLNPACFGNGSSFVSSSYRRLTSCNKTGSLPPSDYDCSKYTDKRREQSTVVNKDGSQTWTAPKNSKYIFRLCGAAGGHDTGSDVDVQVKGYCMYLKVNASLGEKFIILVGQQGEFFSTAGGGGGATFLLSSYRLLAIAGGGGGYYTLNPTYKPYESSSGASVVSRMKREISTTTEATYTNSTIDIAPLPAGEPINLVHLKFSHFYKPRRCTNGSVSYVRKGGFGGGGDYCGGGGGGGAGYLGGLGGNQTSGSNGSSYVDESFAPHDSKPTGYNLGDGYVEILFCNLSCPLPTVCEFDLYEHNYQYCVCPNGNSYLDDVQRDCKDIKPPWISDKTLATIVLVIAGIGFFIMMSILWWYSNFFGDEFKSSIRRRFKDDPVGRKFSSVRFSTVAQRLQAKPLDEIIRLLQEDPRQLRRIAADRLLEYIRPIPYYCIQMGETIGAGHFGTVHKGETVITELGRTDVACKYVECEENNQSHLSIKRQVIMEGVLMSCASLLSKTTIKAYGMAFHEKSVVLVMEYMNGGDLANYLKTQSRPKIIEQRFIENPEKLLLADMIQFMIDIASGCGALEKLRCVHRDLAARNCLLNINSEKAKTVKIGDFGLVKEAELVEYGEGQTRTALPVKWLPLEAIEECNYSNKTDVWSFGIVCWEILTRAKIPYGKRDCIEVANLIKHGQRLKIPEETPKELKELIFRCWYSNPERRPNFQAIETELITILANNGSSMIPPYSLAENADQQLVTPDYHGLDDDWCFQISVGTPSTIATELTTPRSPLDLAFLLDKRQDFEPFTAPRTPDFFSQNSLLNGRDRLSEAPSSSEEFEMQPITLKSPRKARNISPAKDFTALFPPGNDVDQYRKLVNDTYMVPDSKKRQLERQMMALQDQQNDSSVVAVERPTTLNSQEKLFPRNLNVVRKKLINESYEVPESRRRTPCSSVTTPLEFPASPMERPTSLSKQIMFDPKEETPSPVLKYEDLKIDLSQVPLEIRLSPD